MEPQHKKLKRTPVAAHARVFPVQIARLILQFVPIAAPRWFESRHGAILADELVPETPSPIPKELNILLRALSPAYAATVDELTADHDCRVWTIDIKPHKERPLRAIYQTCEASGASVQCLRLRAGDEYEYGHMELFNGTLNAFDARVIDWVRIFSALPNLRRLDLWSIPLHSRQLVGVLDAASLHCKNLSALVMPANEAGHDHVDEQVLPAMEMLETALNRWYCEDGSATGLRQLRVPVRITEPEDAGLTYIALNDRFVRTVARCCPNLEYIDGYKCTFQAEFGYLSCHEYVCCTPDAWRAFCASCTKLRELNWFIVPYLDPFFEIFGQYPKPYLTKLVLAGGEHLDSMTLDDMTQFDNVYSFSANGIAQIFPGCPALKELRIVYASRGDEGSDNCETRQDELTDEVLFSIARHCPQLEAITIEEIRDQKDCVPMADITDDGLEALARLPRLVDIRLKPTRCSGPPTHSHDRDYEPTKQ